MAKILNRFQDDSKILNQKETISFKGLEKTGLKILDHMLSNNVSSMSYDLSYSANSNETIVVCFTEKSLNAINKYKA